MKKLLTLILSVLLVTQLFFTPAASAASIIPIRTVNNSHEGAFYCVNLFDPMDGRNIVRVGVILQGDTATMSNWLLTGSFKTFEGYRVKFSDLSVTQRNFGALTDLKHYSGSLEFTLLDGLFFYYRNENGQRQPKSSFIGSSSATTLKVTCSVRKKFKEEVVVASLLPSVKKLLTDIVNGERGSNVPEFVFKSPAKKTIPEYVIKAPVDKRMRIEFQKFCFRGTPICVYKQVP